MVSVPLSGLSFLIHQRKGCSIMEETGFRPLIGVIISNSDCILAGIPEISFRPLIGVIISN